MAIEQIAVTDLTPCPNNSKIHTKAQIEHIANSITEFGFNDPLAVAGANNVVLEGNGRVEAAKLLGLATLPCVRLDFLTEDEQRAYIIAHNALSLETGFDDSVLLSEIEKLKTFNFEDYGVQTSKYVSKLEKLQEKELKPIRRVHYLVTVDINHNDKIAEVIANLRKIEGVDHRHLLVA